MLSLTMLLVLACPIVLVFPKEKPVLGVVVVWPNGLKRLEAACCGFCGPNKPPVVVLKPAAGARKRTNTSLH